MSDGALARWRRRLTVPFWNGERLRAPWRIVPAVAAVLFIPGLVLGATVQQFDPSLLQMGLAQNATYAATALSLLAVWARYVDRRPLAAYGLRVDSRWFRGAGLGLGVGLVAWGGALATDLAFGWARVGAVLSPGESGLPFAVAMGLFALQWALVGVWEEVVFRGIVLRNAVEGLQPWCSRRTAAAGGLLVSAALFGVLHAGQAGSITALSFWVLTGVILGGAYLLTDSLALPIGLHATFDLAVNNVFGLSSVRAGTDRLPMLVRPAFVGPDRFVEIAGLVNTAWVLLAGVLVLAVVRWQFGSLRVRFGGGRPAGDDGNRPVADGRDTATGAT